MGYCWGKWSLWIIAIVIIIMKCGIETTNGCWDEERDAFLQLNASAPISRSENFWLDVKTSNCCEWDGVTCGKDTRITSLSLSYLVYPVSEEVWHVNASIFLAFQQLRVLELSANNIVSWTEDKGCMKLSSKLSNLQKLELANNRLNSTILMQLSEFQSLQALDLRGNQLDGAISLDYGCNEPNQRLQTPHLYGNTSCSSAFSSLRWLDLSYNNFAGEIPVWLQNLTSLETLNVTGNQLTGNIASSPLIHLLSLKHLDLSYNHLQIPDSFQSFSNHTKLKIFYGDFNQVVHDVSTSIIQPSTTMGLQLELLSLSNCGLHTYPSLLHHQRDLRLVDLSDNVIRGEFPIWLLENNFKLQSLILSNNSLAKSLLLPSFPHPSMMQLTLARNMIQGHIPYNMSEVFPNLVHLDLSSNRFTGCIPSSLCDLKSLKGLYLSNNHLSGEIEPLAKSCINLIVLDLSFNDFEGDLPPFEDLIYLEDLNLEGNSYSSRLRTNMFGKNLASVIIP